MGEEKTRAEEEREADYGKLIEGARAKAETGLGIARSPYGPALMLSNRDTLERQHLQTLSLCDALEECSERVRELEEENEDAND